MCKLLLLLFYSKGEFSPLYIEILVPAGPGAQRGSPEPEGVVRSPNIGLVLE